MEVDKKRRRGKGIRAEGTEATQQYPTFDAVLQTGVPNVCPECEVQEVLARKGGTYFSKNLVVKKKGKSHSETVWMSRSEIIECSNGRQLLDAYKPWDLPTEPELNPLFGEQDRVLDVSTDGALVKWKGLPIGWATWTKDVDEGLVKEYRDRMAHGCSKDIGPGIDILLSDEQREVVNTLAAKIQTGGKYGLLGSIGSVMRAELIAAMMSENEMRWPCLIVCDDSMVSLIVNELRFIGSHKLVILECSDDKDDIECVRKNFWTYENENAYVKFDVAVMGQTAVRELDDRILKVEWNLVVIDATEKMGKRLEQHLKCDYMDGDEITPLDPRKELKWLAHIEDFFVAPNLASRTSITLMSKACSPRSREFFIDSLDDPLEGFHSESVVFVPMSVTQREAYDNVFQNWQSVSFESEDEPERLYREFLDELEVVCANPVLINYDDQVLGWPKSVLVNFCSTSGKFYVLKQIAENVKKENKKMLVLCDNLSTIDVLGAVFAALDFDYSVVKDLSQFNEGIDHEFVLCLFCCDQSINWVAPGFHIVLSFSSVINPIVYLEMTNEDKEQCDRNIEIIRLVTIDSHEICQAGASLNESEDNVSVLRYSKGFYRIPLILACKHINACSVELKREPVNHDKVILFVREDTEDLQPDLSDFEEEFTDECVHQMLCAATSFCWGQWKQMTSSLPVSISEGSMKEIAYRFIEQMSSRVAETPYIIQQLLKEHNEILPPEIQEAVVIFVEKELSERDSEEIYWRLARTEQLLLISLFVSITEKPPADIIVYQVRGFLPRTGWNEEDDKELIYSTFCSGYGRFNMRFCNDDYGHLCDRQRKLCDLYREHVHSVFGEKGDDHSKGKAPMAIKTTEEPPVKQNREREHPTEREQLAEREHNGEPPMKVVDMPKRAEPHIAPKKPEVKQSDQEESSTSEDDWVPGRRPKKPVVKKRPGKSRKKNDSDSEDEYVGSKRHERRPKDDSSDDEKKSLHEKPKIKIIAAPTSKKKPAAELMHPRDEDVIESSDSSESRPAHGVGKKPSTIVPSTTERNRVTNTHRIDDGGSPEDELVKVNHRMRPPNPENNETSQRGKVSYKKAKVSEVFPKNQQPLVVQDDTIPSVVEEKPRQLPVSGKKPQLLAPDQLSKPEQRHESKPEQNHEPKPEHGHEQRSDTKIEPKPEHGHEQRHGTKIEPKPEPKKDAPREQEQVPQHKVKAETKPEPEPIKKAEKKVSIDMAGEADDKDELVEEEEVLELVPYLEGKEPLASQPVSVNGWTRSDQRLIANLICAYGRLETAEIRELVPLEDKTDEEIDEFKEKLLAFVDSGGEAFQEEFLFRPDCAAIGSSLSLFDQMKAADLLQYYDEDRTVIETLLNRGFENGVFSPVLKRLFHEKISPSELKVLAEKALATKLPENTPTEFNTIGERKIAYPVEVAFGIKVSKLGNISPDFYHDEEYIYPVGYTATTEYMGRKVICAIGHGTVKNPVFHVTQMSGARLSCSGRTPDEAWLKYFTRVMKLEEGTFEQWRVPGCELFGLTSPITKRLIQSLPFANECDKYKPRYFRESISHLADIGVFVKKEKAHRKKALKPNEKLVFNFGEIFDKFTKMYGRDAPQSVAYRLDPLMAYSDTTTISAFREELKAAQGLNK